MEGFKTTIIESSREMDPIEAYQMQDTSDGIQLNDIVQDGEVIIDFDMYARVHVVNPANKDKKEYDKTIILDKSGTKFITGSDSFTSELVNIVSQLGGTDGWALKVYTKPSKNYSGDFITCSVVRTK